MIFICVKENQGQKGETIVSYLSWCGVLLMVLYDVTMCMLKRYVTSVEPGVFLGGLPTKIRKAEGPPRRWGSNGSDYQAIDLLLRCSDIMVTANVPIRDSETGWNMMNLYETCYHVFVFVFSPHVVVLNAFVCFAPCWDPTVESWAILLVPRFSWNTWGSKLHKL